MFNEKKAEYSTKQGKEIPVWITPKYEQSKAKAIEIMKNYNNIKEGDFWILMNETKSGKMAYTGLIISHNACLKLNDALSKELQFKPECVSIDKEGYNNSLVFTYICPEQGIYEVGEVQSAQVDKDGKKTKGNCDNAYPYAMALKRCLDRVVLKTSKLAYDGVYSDSEADEFKEKIEEPTTPSFKPVTEEQKQKLKDLGIDIKKFAVYLKKAEQDLTFEEVQKMIVRKVNEIEKNKQSVAV